MFAEADLIPISALQHWVYCPRQCGLIHLEACWEENRLTAEGRLLHQKAHEPTLERQGQVRLERGLALRSRVLGIAGVADVVEFHPGGPLPVEYKRGRAKRHDADRVQLCAQALCLEEMLGVAVPTGALFYGASRRREVVALDAALRARVARVIGEVRAMLASGRTPPPLPGKACANCSLVETCLPHRLAAPEAASRYLGAQLAAARREEP